MTSTHDLVVVGTGWYGLIAAKTYLDLHPDEDVILLDAEDSVGGVWSTKRLYPQLVTQNMLDTYEYPGCPMNPDKYGVKEHQHIPGTTVHHYLTDYAHQTGLYSRIRFGTKIESLEETAEHDWIITVENRLEPIRAKRIILGTGLTSQPNFPHYPGAEDFGAPYFHAKDFAQHADSTTTIKNVVVVGSAKSAFDVSYAYAVAGAHVDLVVRPSGGKGPVWMAYPWIRGLLRVEKVAATRVVTWFSPCSFGGVDGWGWVRSFLHGTRLGRLLVSIFWALLEWDIVQTVGYEHPRMRDLKPRSGVFWMGANLSIHNYEQNLFDMIKSGRVQVHVADVDHLSPKMVHLKSGERLKAEALICATGWKKEPSIRFINMGETGPLHPPFDPVKTKAADENLLRRFPRLRASPATQMKHDPLPLRLYRFMVPPAHYENRNIACVGLILTASTSSMAAAQALWISAFFDNKLCKQPASKEMMIEDCLLHTQWGHWRYPYGHGSSFPDFIFDALPYSDLLLNDLGLKVRRKPSLFKELFQPYGPQDFVGLVDEWVAAHPSITSGSRVSTKLD